MAGKHGSLVDSMILVRAVPRTRTVTMLSVPRDLYVNNRKINAVWQSFGMDELKRQLGRITGYEVDHFVLVDMYVFIDLVDLLGGIDVTLTERVVDPSYRTLDNGVWSTMRYEPGTYHLRGAQALRLARSRHYSSDFARAARQQMLLEGIRDKVRDFGASDIGTLTEMVQVAISRTETDLTPEDAISAFLRYKGYTIRRGAVLSTGNVLESMRTNDAAADAAAAACGALPPSDPARAACDARAAATDRGAYILLPRGGNWQVIKWFAWKTFEDG